MTDKPDRKPWGCGMWTLTGLGCILALWIGGCCLQELTVARKLSLIKPGMAKAQVDAILGQPFLDNPVEPFTRVRYECNYRGSGDEIEIIVMFDGNKRVLNTQSSRSLRWIPFRT